MKIIYPRVCGIDVHKQFIVAVICISESVEPIYLKKRFSTFHAIDGNFGAPLAVIPGSNDV